ncbi:MAG: NADH-quinone oxidoreductase subunit H [Candidatus Obscuribacterales bacterium]|nr:NADH-quinone oxidoreductase subunit H [Candidatus Obscuribacterales bacterium]
MTSSAVPYNLNEIGKFFLLSGVWLGIIFGAVWAACWAVGMLVPQLILNAYPNDPCALNVANAIRLLTPLVGVMVFIPINAMYMVLAERRGLALFTVRKGPNRVGPDGFLQTAADAVKLLFKENINPHGGDVLMFTLAPIIFFAPSVFGAIPLLAAVTSNHDLFKIVNLPTGIFYVLAMSSIPVVGIVMGGWASNNKYSLVGGLRSAAQAISYEIPLVLAIITTCFLVGSLDVVNIAQMQKGTDNLASFGFLNWNFFGAGAIPHYLDLLMQGKLEGAQVVTSAFWSLALAFCCILLCGIYLTGACAEINRIPFDLPEAESELVSGYNTEYSGIRFAIFFLAEFTNLFIVSTVAVVMWFGGGATPFPGFLDANTFASIATPFNQALAQAGLPPLMDGQTMSGAFWAIFKTYALVYFAILVRGTLPRFRIDQLLDFGWKKLIPLSLILLLAVTYIRELV